MKRTEPLKNAHLLTDQFNLSGGHDNLKNKLRKILSNSSEAVRKI